MEKEYMRMAMLKHEEIFKEQIYELHRLYRVQKILMKNMESRRGNEVNEREWYFNNAISLTQNVHNKGAQEKPQMKIDLEKPAEEHIAESDDEELDNIDEAEIELTLGPSRYSHRKKFSAPDSHTLSSSYDRSCNINTTRCKTYKSSYSKTMQDSTSGFQSGIRNSFGIEEQLKQDRFKQSPWLLQVLNLNI
ncbi:hypothetical protein Lal_00040117 [Lupinus albus]|uniref:Uncharacterized protein n=1 Tax=Lupinus albus TaxID=3870 RepID=A0A6A4Q150_LUPAL|nr:hypothetical protein Lalb_Chr09g0334051 [Lupinus albus]KAF1862847.1 hypothetical protein Lal_00040117 [Lupinus albus]